MERTNGGVFLIGVLFLLLVMSSCIPTANTGPEPVLIAATVTTTVRTELPQPSPTATNTPVMATELPPTDLPPAVLLPTILPTATATAEPSAADLDNTLLLYSTLVLGEGTPTPINPGNLYYAFRTLPGLPFIDPAVFDTFYGEQARMSEGGIGMFLDEFRPQVSPDSRYVLLPGLTNFPEYGIEGTGTWLLDLVAGTARQLFPDGVLTTWNPTSDAIAYVQEDTLYTLGVTEDALPQPLFQHPSLWRLYAKWSPDGEVIAVVTTADDPAAQEYWVYQHTYWLVPADGRPAQELATREAYAVEYSSREMSWSADGQYLLMRNEVFDRAGHVLSPDYKGIVSWLGDESRLLFSSDGLSIISITGEELARISDASLGSQTTIWAMSPDGQQLAYTLPQNEDGIPVSLYDLAGGESHTIGVVPSAVYVQILRWSSEGNLLFAGAYGQNGRQAIWSLDPTADEPAELVLDSAELIEVVRDQGARN